MAYRLMYVDPKIEELGADGDEVLRGTYPTVKQAMKAAGLPDPSQWKTASGLAGSLFVKDEWKYYPDAVYAVWEIRSDTAFVEVPGGSTFKH